MRHFIFRQNSHLRISLTFCVVGTCLFLSSCASTGRRPRATRTAEPDSRSELVLLNIPEASGWVAYNCNPGGTPEMEDYRVVVIRQKSGEIIYDSQIPLAADLCTHGFEMAPDDPRLQRLARNVDTEIIDPLEAYQRSLEEKPMAPEPVAPEPEAKASPTPDPAAPGPEAADSTPASAPQPAQVKILGMAEGRVLLDLADAETLQPGDRLFLRHNPTVIALPGSDETFVASEGEVAGLVEVVSVKDTSAQAKILSGSVPESGYAEIIVKP